MDYLTYPVDRLEQMSREDDTDALLALGMLYFEGVFVKKNRKKAMVYWERAGVVGNTLGSFLFANCLFAGIDGGVNAKRAFSRYAGLHERGYSPATYNMALCYETGNGVVKSAEKAVPLYELTEDITDGLSSFRLGGMYYHGHGVQKNLMHAFEYYTRAAESGNLQAHMMLGRMYEHGTGVPRDIAHAMRHYAAGGGLSEHLTPFTAFIHEDDLFWGGMLHRSMAYHKTAVEQNKDEDFSRLILTCHYIKNEDYETAEALLRDLSLKGYSEAQYIYCGLIARGIYRESAGFSAAALCRLAVGAGHIGAILLLTDMLLSANAAPDEELLQLYKQAEQLGSGRARYILANTCYFDLEDYDNAFGYYQNLENYQNDFLSLQLAVCYLEGRGTDASPSKALIYLERAARRFNGAQLLLASMRASGIGCVRDMEKAKNTAVGCANQLYTNYALANACWQNGEHDFAQSYYFACLAHDVKTMGDDCVFSEEYDERILSSFNKYVLERLGIDDDIKPMVCYTLGMYNYNGHDAETALYYFIMAANSGHPQSQYMSGRLLFASEQYGKAASWYELAAKSNVEGANYMAAHARLLAGDSAEEYLRLLADLAKYGNLCAAYFLDVAGNGETNPETDDNHRAVYDLAVRISQGETTLFFELAEMARDGIGMDKNPGVALEYFKRCDGTDNPAAILQIAALYIESDDNAQRDNALALYTELAQQGVAEAVYRLGALYEDSRFNGQDRDYAIRCYLQAAALGFPAAVDALDAILRTA